MKFFKHEEKTTIPELQEYYENQKSNRTGTAWLMAVASLVITISVLSGLFFGGRWVYRTITDRNDKQTTEQSKGDNTSKTSENATSQNNANSGKVTDNAASTTTPSGGGSSGVAGSSTGSTSTTASSSAPSIPNTGPADLILTFVAVGIFITAYVGHLTYQSQKNR